MCQLEKLRRTELTGSSEPKSGRSSVNPDGEVVPIADV
jgi:hypothetical protein